MLIGRLLGAYQLFVVSLLGVNQEFVWSLSRVCLEFVWSLSAFEFSRSFQVPIGNLTFVCWILSSLNYSHK